MTSALKTWRQSRQEATYWTKARARSESLPTGEVVGLIELALMTAGQAISRWRQTTDKEARQDQLLELRMNLEAALGMLDNVLKEK